MADKLVPSDGPSVSKADLALIKQTIAVGATDEELKLFLFDCKRRGTHPLDRQIHFAKIGGRYQAIVGIDYLRSRAAMTGEYAGSTDPVIVRDDDGTPVSATMSVFRLVQGQRCEFAATALFAEYCPNRGGGTWATLPTVMLSKVVESLCLRKGFPSETSGLYTRAELDQSADDVAPSRPPAPPKKKVRRVSPVPAAPAPAPAPVEEAPFFQDGPPSGFDEVPHPADIPAEVVEEEAPAPRRQASNGGQARPISEKQQKRLFAIAMSHGRDIDDVAHYIKETYDYGHMSEILRADYEAIVEWVETD